MRQIAVTFLQLRDLPVLHFHDIVLTAGFKTLTICFDKLFAPLFPEGRNSVRKSRASDKARQPRCCSSFLQARFRSFLLR